MFDITYRTCTTDCDQNTLLTLSPYTKEKIKALERVQRRATKFILKCDLTYQNA